MVLKPPEALPIRESSDFSMQILVVIDIELGATPELQLVRRVQLVNAVHEGDSQPSRHGLGSSSDGYGCPLVMVNLAEVTVGSLGVVTWVAR